MYLMLKKCASPNITFWVLIYMMLLLIFGTLAQKYIGLYGALETYFYAWILWAGVLPLPGGLSIMTVFFINLISRFIGYSRWSWNKAGIHLAHAGVILLLIGGITSAISRVDSVIPISPAQLKHETQSYDQSAISIYRNDVRLTQIPLKKIVDSQTLNLEEAPFDLKILNVCQNCEIAIDKDDGGMTLIDKSTELDREQNLSGITFNFGDSPDRHIAFLHFPKPPQLENDGDIYTIKVERVFTPLPFDIKLRDFRIEFYPGTLQAESYTSDIEIIDDGSIIPATISMNKPVTHKGYKFYQSAYQTDTDGKYTSIIAVVKNQGNIFPYIAGLITAFGLLLHVVFLFKGRVSQSAIKFSVLAFFLLPVLMPSDALADIKTGHDFATLPVLHDGRIKPIDSFARIHLKMFSGKARPLNEAPSQTLARIIFNPYDAVRLEIFQIKNQNILSSFGLAERSSKLYSYEQLAKGLDDTRDDFITAIKKQQDGQNLNEYETAVSELHSRALYFLQLVRSFSFAMPLDGSSDDTVLDYRSLQKNTILLRDALDSIQREKGDDISAYSPAETETAYLNYQLDTLEKTGRNNLLLRIIPSSDAREMFTAPWQILTNGKGTPQSQDYVENWVWMMIAFQSGSEQLWLRSINQLNDLYEGALNDTHYKNEYYYNVARPISLSILLAFLSALFYIFAQSNPRRIVARAALLFSGATTATLGSVILFRILLLGRPPVGTLYESILFVTFILTAGLLYLHRKKPQNGVMSTGFLMAGFLLLLAKTIDTAQDNLQLMEAVLNTNFWLATHVLIITAGYAWCILTSVLAHIDLYNKNRTSKKSSLHTHGLISLFLMTTGTILGGIWADMSWGRFWGWDPKENGALLIILWLIWALHSRASYHLNHLLFKCAMAALSMIVMLSWFGVNLLNVGLHSYGFITGLAYALFGFIAIETLIIFALYNRFSKS